MKQIIFSVDSLQQLNNLICELPHKYAVPLLNIINSEIKRNFDEAADTLDQPSGATVRTDEFAGD